MTDAFPTGWDEASRLDALRALKLLDTPAEERFDRITRTVQQIFRVPIVLVSLVDANRQWFKSCQGLDVNETPRTISFCTHAILQDDIFIVEDATQDPLFAGNPLVVGPPFIRFYAGKPLQGLASKKVGTLCLIDHVPRMLSDAERAQLDDLSAWAERELNAISADTEALSRLEARLRLAHALEHAAEGMISTDLSGFIETVNPAACTMSGFSADEMLGKNIRDLIPSRDQARHRDFILRLCEGTAASTRIGVEALGVRKNGSEFSIEVSFSMLNAGGRQFFSGIVRDINERKHVERMKSEFIANVSHELRTPLTSILGALGLLRDESNALSVDDTRRLVDVAYLNGQRLNALINDVLDVEKMDAGMIAFHTERFPIHEVIDEVCMLNRPFAERLQVELRSELAPGPDLVEADRARLIQVLTNLVSNACKFSSAGKAVVVATERREKWIRVGVIDQGPGIPDEFRGRIFQRFAQARASQSNRQTGTGLGLSLSKAMIEKMGGRIGFDSVAGQGATFFIELLLSV